MSSTTPAAEPAPQGRDEQRRTADEEVPAVPMRTLLASCAAAAAVSTPPEPKPHADEPRRAA